MQKRIWSFVAAALVACCGYGLFFAAQEYAFKGDIVTLKPAPPVKMLQVVTGYGRQLTAEILFVQGAVFIGGLHQDLDPQGNARVLAHNYMTAVQLYPQFRDTYYHAQSFLAGLDEESTRKVNDMLEIAWKTYRNRFTDRNRFIYPFFEGFNCFSYLNDRKRAAEIFAEVSLKQNENAPKQNENAPKFFEHMSVLLRAEGGELAAGLESLQLLVQTTDDPVRKEKYEEEIGMFQQAIKVQQAVQDFFARNQRYPTTLEELIPDYLESLPDFKNVFELVWNPPQVELHRPRLKGFQGVRHQ